MSETEKIYTPEDSASGLNAHIHWCDVHEQKRYFCICARLVDAWQAGQLASTDELRGDCSSAMDAGRCPAVKMRREELAAGKAIYHIPRAGTLDRPGLPLGQAKIDRSSPSYIAGWNKVGAALRSADTRPVASQPTKTAVSAPRRIAKSEPAIVEMNLGKLVTEMTAEEGRKTAVRLAEKPSASISQSAVGKSAPVQKATPKGGESLLEMARRLRAERQGATT